MEPIGRAIPVSRRSGRRIWMHFLAIAEFELDLPEPWPIGHHTRDLLQSIALERRAIVRQITKGVHGNMPRLQIVSIADWFAGERPTLPPHEQIPYGAFAESAGRQRARRVDLNQPELPLSYLGDRSPDDVARHLNPQMIRLTAKSA